MNKEENRRIKYTRRVIREAYFELLKQKPIGQITIGELCELADVHRGTFYQHYHDIYDLQEKIEAELMDKFDSLLSLQQSDQMDMAEMTVLTIFEEKDMCTAILGENGNSDVLKRIIEKFRQSSYAKYGKMGIDPKDFNVVYVFATSGCIGVIRDWVMRGYPEKPEDVITIIRKMSFSGISGFNSVQPG